MNVSKQYSNSADGMARKIYGNFYNFQSPLSLKKEHTHKIITDQAIISPKKRSTNIFFPRCYGDIKLEYDKCSWYHFFLHSAFWNYVWRVFIYIYFYDTCYHKLKGKGTKSYLKLLFLVRELLKFCHACIWFYHTLLNLRLSWLFLRWTTLAINSHASTKRGLTAGRGILWSLFRYNITRSFKHNAYRIFTLRNTGLIEQF